MSDGDTTEEEYHQQADENKRTDDETKTVIAFQHTPFRADQSQAAGYSRNRLIADQASLTAEYDAHTALLARCHLMPKSDDVGILLWVGIAEDRLLEQQRRIRMQVVVSVFAYQHIIGIRIRLLCRNEFR